MACKRSGVRVPVSPPIIISFTPDASLASTATARLGCSARISTNYYLPVSVGFCLPVVVAAIRSRHYEAIYRHREQKRHDQRQAQAPPEQPVNDGGIHGSRD